MRGFWVAAAAALISCNDASRVRQLGGILDMQPSTLEFGDVALGKDLTRQVAVQNTGLVPVSVSQLQELNDPAFVVNGLPFTLGPGQVANVTVRYRPPQLGSHANTLQIATDSPEMPQTNLGLHGHAVRGLATLSGNSFDFGNVVVGEKSSQALSLANHDGHAVTSVAIAAPGGVDSDAFAVGHEGQMDMQPDQQLVVNIDFTPSRLGPFVANVAVTPCPTCDPQTIQLTGRGVNSLLAVAPANLDFHNVALGGNAQLPFSITNTSAGPLVLEQIGLSGNPELTAELPNTKLPFTMAPGETLQGVAHYAPRTLRQVSAQASFAANDGAPGVLSMTGSGIGAVVQVTPRSMFVGTAALGTTRTGEIQVTNSGYDPQNTQPLVVTNVSVISPDPAWRLLTPTPINIGAPGSSATIKFSFTPTQAGLSQVVLGVDSNDGLHPEVDVPISGQGRVLKPCTLQVQPATPVDFGAVQLFQPSVQGFELYNTTGDDCVVGDPQIVSGGPAFRWPGGVAPSGRTLPPNGRMSVRIEFQAEAQQSYFGRVQFYVSNASAQTYSVDLEGTGDGSCFFISPGTVDFGTTTQGCGTNSQPIYAVNHCAYTVRVTNAQTSGAPFSIGSVGLPYDVAPQTSLAIPVEYAPPDTGDDVGQIYVTSSESPVPRQAGVTGGSQQATTILDQWDQSTPKVDMLIVIDNSGSMAEEQQALAQNLDHLWNRIALANADFHIAVTSTGMQPYTGGWSQCPGGANGGEGGRFFPVDNSRPRLLTPDTPNVRDALFANTAVGTCHWDEQFSEPVVAALTQPLVNSAKAPGTPWPADGNAGFLRDDARLALLAVSDTDDDIDSASPPPVSWLVDNLVAAKHGAKDLISFAGIVPLSVCSTEESLAPRYGQIAQALSGHLYDICNLSNFGTLLDNALGDLLLPLSSFPLSAKPRDPAAIQVQVNGVGTTAWSYDATSNRIVFPQTAVPVPGSHITARYQPACQ